MIHEGKPTFKLLRSLGIDSASLCCLAGRYDNPIPTRFLATIDCSKIPAQGPVCRPAFFIPESNEWFTEDQAFSRSYGLAPPPPPPPVSKRDRRHTGRQRKRDNLLMGEGVWDVREKPNHTTTIKHSSLYIIQYSLLYPLWIPIWRIFQTHKLNWQWGYTWDGVFARQLCITAVLFGKGDRQRKKMIGMVSEFPSILYILSRKKVLSLNCACDTCHACYLLSAYFVLPAKPMAMPSKSSWKEMASTTRNPLIEA